MVAAPSGAPPVGGKVNETHPGKVPARFWATLAMIAGIVSETRIGWHALNDVRSEGRGERLGVWSTELILYGEIKGEPRNTLTRTKVRGGRSRPGNGLKGEAEKFWEKNRLTAGESGIARRARVDNV